MEKNDSTKFSEGNHSYLKGLTLATYEKLTGQVVGKQWIISFFVSIELSLITLAVIRYTTSSVSHYDGYQPTSFFQIFLILFFACSCGLIKIKPSTKNRNIALIFLSICIAAPIFIIYNMGQLANY